MIKNGETTTINTGHGYGILLAQREPGYLSVIGVEWDGDKWEEGEAVLIPLIDCARLGAAIEAADPSSRMTWKVRR